MKQFLLAASLLTLIGTQASAGFLTNRQEWNNASHNQKAGFVQGVFSEMVMNWTTDSKTITDLKAKLHICVSDMKLTDLALVDVVDSHYTDLEQWADPANIALRIGLLKVCNLYEG